ncbi:MAG: hypothetical protein WCI22_13490 [Actinomycetota bacterium]
MPSNPSATLAVMADHLERYHHEMGDLLPGYQTKDQADMVNAIVECERTLRQAARALRKASKLASNTQH